MSTEGDVAIAMVGDIPANIHAALEIVIKKALVHNGILKGLHECAKSLERSEVKLCLLADNCDQDAYKKLVEALCLTHGVPLIKFPDNKQLGQWSGLCKINKEGNPCKTVRTSVIVIKDWGEESEEKTLVTEYIARKSA